MGQLADAQVPMHKAAQELAWLTLVTSAFLKASCKLL
jgi:hypothetical protein